MQRIAALSPTEATGKAKQLLDSVQAKLGITPNLMKTLASWPAVLEADLNFNSALGTGLLDAKFREQIALAVAQANSCEYCLSAHPTIGKMVGLRPDEITSSRESCSQDAKRQAGLQFAQALVVQRGEVSDASLENLKKVATPTVRSPRSWPTSPSISSQITSIAWRKRKWIFLASPPLWEASHRQLPHSCKGTLYHKCRLTQHDISR